MTRTEIYAKIVGEYLAEIEFGAAPRLLYDPIRYAMESGGKRLRPMFVVAACGLWREDVSDALPAAAALEMFHNFTLLHDDIMDNAPVRRGRPSVRSKWSTNVAIMAGDGLVIRAYSELAKTRPQSLAAVIGYFSEAAVKVCEGQQFDMDFEELDSVRMAEHIAMIELKTSSLFVGGVSMGAVVGGASAVDVARLREFAGQFGVAFQIQDDLLDSYGDERMGKTVGGDIIEGKKTFLKLHAMAEATADDRAELAMIHKDLRYAPEEKITRVLALYDRYGAREAAEAEISRRYDAAAAALDALTAPKDRIEEFKALTLSQLGRTK